jgi:alpha-L-arabinofuranosidase
VLGDEVRQVVHYTSRRQVHGFASLFDSGFKCQQVKAKFFGLHHFLLFLFSACMFLQTSCYTQTKPHLSTANTVSDIAITNKVHQEGVKRFGINLGRTTFYDSGQILRNFTFRNPGFEGESWRSILRCKTITSTTCIDGNQYAVWPENFLKGAHFEFISGSAIGISGTIQSSLPARYPEHGVSFNYQTLSRTPSPNDFVLVSFERPGGADKGWWTNTMNSGAKISTEFKDLSPRSPGRQALRIQASGPNQVAHLDSYFDTYEGRSFVQLKGRYTFSFRAKGISGNNSISVHIIRNGTEPGGPGLFPSRVIHLSAAWKDYSYEWTASEDGSQVGPVDISFSVNGADVLLDDVSVEASASMTNKTAFRNEVVEALRDLKPGILRYSDPAVDSSTTVDNVIAPSFARIRAGFSTQANEQDQVPLGLSEFLELCRTVNAEPWYAMPATIDPQQIRNLVEYLGGSSKTKYGAMRARSGQIAPWTGVFPLIHLEFGNELWNEGTFYGAAMSDPVSYGKRAAELFTAARSSPNFLATHFDLVLGSQEGNAWWTGQELANSSGFDSIAVAPYLFNNLNDTSSDEVVFGPMFSEVETTDSRPNGSMALQTKASREAKHPAKLAVYEVNLGTDHGSAQQSAIDAVVPSLASGLAVVEHMLLMLRELGVTTQSTYALTGYANKFTNLGGGAERSPLWGEVIDMGGGTNRRRPVFIAQRMANEAILPHMIDAQIGGDDPTWDQGLNKNSVGQPTKSHYLQVFAFSQGHKRSLMILNLDREKDHSITLSGDSPNGSVQVSQLTSRHVTDTNEQSDMVRSKQSTITQFKSKKPYSLPPVSMTTFVWTSSR